MTWRQPEALLAAVRAHCLAKGYREGPGVNNFVPHDAALAFAMATELARAGFDRVLAIAPEGHIYGYFFERLGVLVEELFVDYPPTRVSCAAIPSLAGQRVLLIEDDVIGGGTLRLVFDAVAAQGPQSIALCLGHSSGIQHLHNVPEGIGPIYLADRFAADGEAFNAAFAAFVATV